MVAVEKRTDQGYEEVDWIRCIVWEKGGEPRQKPRSLPGSSWLEGRWAMMTGTGNPGAGRMPTVALGSG